MEYFLLARQLIEGHTSSKVYTQKVTKIYTHTIFFKTCFPYMREITSSLY